MKVRFFLACVSLLFLAACVQERPEALSVEMKKQLALLPQESDLIGHINLEQIQQSTLFKPVLDSLQDHILRHKEFDEFKSATGFDFQKDAKNIYFAATLNKNEDEMNGLFVANGNFDADKIVSYIISKNDSEKVAAEPYESFNLYRIPDEQSVFCFPDPHTLVGGKEIAVKEYLDKFVKPGDAQIVDAWLERIESLRYKNGCWLAMTTEKFKEIMEQEHLFPKKLQGLKNIKNGSASLELTERMSFEGQAECSDPEKAGLLRDAVKGFLATAKLAVSEERDLVDIINKVSVETKQERVIVRFKMSAEEIEKLMQKKNAHPFSAKI